MKTTLRHSSSPRPLIAALGLVGVILIGFAFVFFGPDWLAIVGIGLMFLVLTIAALGRQWWSPRDHNSATEGAALAATHHPAPETGVTRPNRSKAPSNTTRSSGSSDHP